MNYFKKIYEDNEKEINIIKNILFNHIKNLNTSDFDIFMNVVNVMSFSNPQPIPEKRMNNILTGLKDKLLKKNKSFSCYYFVGAGNLYSSGNRLVVEILGLENKISLVFNVDFTKNVYFSQIDFITLDKITNSCIEFSFRNESTTFKIVDNNLNQINEYSYSYNKKSYFKFCKDDKYENIYIFKGSKIEELSLALNFCYNLNRTDTSFLTNILFDNMLDKKSIQQEIKDLFLLKYDIIISDYKDLINIDEKLKLIDNNLNLKAIKNRFNNFFKKI